MDAEKKMTMREAAGKGLLSQDVAEEKREQLRQLFPEVFTEGKIDFEQLRRVMGDWVEPGKERYGLNWPGKADCMKVIQAPSIATLKPARGESVDFDDTENLFIEGDNLEVLKLLQKAYFGKIKMIYIDPPYNTGKEFIYPDKYQENLDTYLAYTGQIDSEGNRFSTNTDAGGRFHTNWLNMMYPRLYLARNLLREDGVVWTSIDDNELSSLINLSKEVFGIHNFVGVFIWEKRKTRENRKIISVNHDYIVCVAKNKEVFEGVIGALPLTEEAENRYKNPDNDPRGLWQSVSINGQADAKRRREQFYTITTPSGRNIDPPPGRCWIYTEPRFRELVDDNRIWFGEDGNNAPRIKMFKKDDAGLTPHTLWKADEVGTTDTAKKYIVELFDSVAVFDTPKPVELISRAIHISDSSDGVFLDFFAGSSPLAEAIYRANLENSGSRKFICVQLPEHCDENSEAAKAGYRTIAEVGKERIRRAAKRISSELESKLDLEGVGELDLGFKVFKLDRSNFAIWDGDAERAEELAKQLEMHVDHIDQASGPEDILYELLLKAGFELTTKVEKQAMASKDVYAVADGALLICLDKEITPELIDALADADPLQVICLDEGFKGNDQLKTNAVQTFKSRAKEDEEAIVFRTV